MIKLEDVLKPTQQELYDRISKTYAGRISRLKGGFVLVQGEAPVMLVAHLDTVHHEPVKQICKTQDGNILMSPQGIGGDDRCGVYALQKVYESAIVKPWLLFTCDEETGCVGAGKFVDRYQRGKLPKMDGLKMIIEIDRKGQRDAVFYSCDNPEFEKYVTGKGFKTAQGSFSDISEIAPVVGVAAVNLSSGYYNAHQTHEYINRRHLNFTVRKVLEMVEDSVRADFPKYEYIEAYYPVRQLRGQNIWADWDYPKSTASKKQKDERYDIPQHLLYEWSVLLDFYSFEELKEIHIEYGDEMIHQMYQDEVAPDYEDDEDWGAVLCGR